ncbi:transposase [Xanthobacter dioxanivorans]|uniref:Transposase n=1 Tax=Xanthobacter dioxanivorans TaxID=2528964 RepID=A0A974PSH6_9HYPH|nr:transposase [Xanthobacter dioxanivorans]
MKGRKRTLAFSPWLYRQRNLIERFFSKLKYYRAVETRYEKLATNFFAAVKLAAADLDALYNSET